MPMLHLAEHSPRHLRIKRLLLFTSVLLFASCATQRNASHLFTELVGFSPEVTYSQLSTADGFQPVEFDDPDSPDNYASGFIGHKLPEAGKVYVGFIDNKLTEVIFKQEMSREALEQILTSFRHVMTVTGRERCSGRMEYSSRGGKELSGAFPIQLSHEDEGFFVFQYNVTTSMTTFEFHFGKGLGFRRWQEWLERKS